MKMLGLNGQILCFFRLASNLQSGHYDPSAFLISQKERYLLCFDFCSKHGQTVHTIATEGQTDINLEGE